MNNLESESNPNSELETIFKEHWNHARHCENERLQYTSIYAVVMAAILYVIGNTNFNPTRGLLLAFLGLILSIIGFFIVITLSLGYEHHISDIYMIFYRWDKMEFYRHPSKPFYFLDLHRWFFEITITLFSVLLISYGYQGLTSRAPSHGFLAVLTVMFVIIAYGIDKLYQIKWVRYVKECWDFEKALRNDTEGTYRKDWDTWFKDLDFRKKIANEARKRRKEQKK